MARMKNRERLLKKMAALPAAVRQEMKAAIKQSADEIVALQKSLAPEESGDLIRSIRAVSGTYRPENSNVRGMSAGVEGDPDLTVTIVAGDANAWYARLVEFGTKPHTIKAKRPGGLLNVFGLFVERVEHPGAKPRPFFYPAYRSLRRRAKGRITRAAKKAARKVAAEQ